MNNHPDFLAPSARDRRARRRPLACGKPQRRRKALDGRSVGARSDPARLAHRPIHHQTTTRGSNMKIDDVRRTAYAMPLTNPVVSARTIPLFRPRISDRHLPHRPPGLARGRTRAARAHRAAGEIRVHSHARFDRVRRLHRIRTGDPRALCRRGRASTCTRCISTTMRRSPAAASCGASRRSWRSPKISHEGEVIVGTLHYGQVAVRARPRWATSTARRTSDAVLRSLRAAELRAEDHSSRRRQRLASASWCAITSRTSS